MSNSPEIHGSGLRGMSRLAFDGIAGLIGMVETMHGNIAGHSGLARRAEGKTRGITRLVYRSIRGVTHLTGIAVDAALSLLDPILTVEHPTPSREARRAVINGVLGDHLAETSNPLAIPMCLRRHGRPLRLERNSLAEALTSPSGRLVVLLHGYASPITGCRRCCAIIRNSAYWPLTLLESFRCIRLTLWDETQRRLVSFRDLRACRVTGLD